jgi:cyclopropane fatty-acyl-phospholipid synthase-like methyltransferase
MNNLTTKFYNENAVSLTKKYESADVQELQNFLTKEFSGKKKLLELGCGSGRDCAYMLSQNHDILGIDASKQLINEAIKQHPELTNKLRHLLMPNGLSQIDSNFDGIYSIATLMHLSTPEIKSSIKMINKLLIPSGKFVFSVSTFRNDVNEEGIDKNGRFFNILPTSKWVNLCKEVGFKNIHTKETSTDGLSRQGITWLTITATKPN